MPACYPSTLASPDLLGTRVHREAGVSARLLVALWLVATAGMAGIAGMVPRGASAAEPLRVVVLPVVVHSAASDSRYVSRGLLDMLSSRLEQLGELLVIQADSGTGTNRLSEALETGRALGGDYVVYGAFTQFGDGASLDVRCVPLADTGEERAAAGRRIFIQSGNVSEIIPKLDELVDRVAHFLDRPASPPAPGLTPPAQSVAEALPDPSSPTGGLDALRDRIDALEQAVYGLTEESAESAGVIGDADVAPES